MVYVYLPIVAIESGSAYQASGYYNPKPYTYDLT